MCTRIERLVQRAKRVEKVPIRDLAEPGHVWIPVTSLLGNGRRCSGFGRFALCSQLVPGGGCEVHAADGLALCT